MKILIVENREPDAKLLRSVLERGGHQVSSVASAEQAVRVLEELEAPALIVTDLDLPEMDGQEMARRLKREPRTARIPVVAVTAYPDNFAVRHGDLGEFAAYVVKPINTRSFAQFVAEVYSRCAN